MASSRNQLREALRAPARSWKTVLLAGGALWLFVRLSWLATGSVLAAEGTASAASWGPGVADLGMLFAACVFAAGMVSLHHLTQTSGAWRATAWGGLLGLIGGAGMLGTVVAGELALGLVRALLLALACAVLSRLLFLASPRRQTTTG